MISNLMKLSNISIANDPIQKVIDLLESKSKADPGKRERSMKDWCVNFFGDMDKWVPAILINDDISKDIIDRIYSILANLFLKCSDLLYKKVFFQKFNVFLKPITKTCYVFFF